MAYSTEASPWREASLQTGDRLFQKETLSLNRYYQSAAPSVWLTVRLTALTLYNIYFIL